MKSAAQRHNEKMDKIFTPQIERLKKYEKVSEDILQRLEKLVDIDPCGLERCHLINAISKILQQQTEVKATN